MAKKNKNNTFYIIGIIILVIVLIAVAAYFVLHKKNNKATSSSGNPMIPLPTFSPPSNPLILSINVLKSFTSYKLSIDVSKLNPNIISVDWGDGSGVTTNFSHQYSTPGTYQIKIYGNLNSLDFTDFQVGETQLRYYSDFYTIGIKDFGSSYNTLRSINFNVYTDVNNIPLSLPPNVTKLSFGTVININCDIRKLDVSNITDMSNMFNDCASFNQDISGWDVSKVTNMSNIFNGCTTFNQPIGKWNMVSVTNTSGMFSNCVSFNQPLE